MSKNKYIAKLSKQNEERERERATARAIE